MAFEKGCSGNPGGRSKVEGAIRDIAQLHGPAAIQKLAAMIEAGERLERMPSSILATRRSDTK